MCVCDVLVSVLSAMLAGACVGWFCVCVGGGGGGGAQDSDSVSNRVTDQFGHIFGTLILIMSNC